MASASRFAPASILIPRSLPPWLPFKTCSVSPPRSWAPSSLFPRRSGCPQGRYRSPGGAAGGGGGGSPHGEDPSFGRAVELFNGGDYHGCHDFLEELWYEAEEPARTLLHGILQCSVGLHHLFNQNHRGAMMELGEGLCKLKKMDFEDGPLFEFEQEVSALLEFLYQTQKELAACTDDFCLAMDGSEKSYQLLGSFASGQRVYQLVVDPDGSAYIVFSPVDHYSSNEPLRIKVPILRATEEHLKAYEC